MIKERHDVMTRCHLVRQSLMTEQRKHDQIGVTKNHVTQIRHDISTLRYEIIDILHSNGMKTPHVNVQNPSGEHPSQSGTREFVTSLSESSRSTFQHEFRPLTPIQEDPQEYMISTGPPTPVISMLTKDKSPVKIPDVRTETPTHKYIKLSDGDATTQKGTKIDNEVKLQENRKDDKKEKTKKQIETKQKESRKRDSKPQEHSTKKSIQGKLKVNIEVLKRWLQNRFHIV